MNAGWAPSHPARRSTVSTSLRLAEERMTSGPTDCRRRRAPNLWRRDDSMVLYHGAVPRDCSDSLARPGTKQSREPQMFFMLSVRHVMCPTDRRAGNTGRSWPGEKGPFRFIGELGQANRRLALGHREPGLIPAARRVHHQDWRELPPAEQETGETNAT